MHPISRATYNIERLIAKSGAEKSRTEETSERVRGRKMLSNN